MTTTDEMRSAIIAANDPKPMTGLTLGKLEWELYQQLRFDERRFRIRNPDYVMLTALQPEASGAESLFEPAY